MTETEIKARVIETVDQLNSAIREAKRMKIRIELRGTPTQEMGDPFPVEHFTVTALKIL